MPGSKVVVHKGKGEKHEYASMHLCVHCLTQHECGPGLGHNPESCEVPPEFACADCTPRIFRGTFSFGHRFDDCHEDCMEDTKYKYFKHARRCNHHREAIVDKAIEKSFGTGA